MENAALAECQLLQQLRADRLQEENDKLRGLGCNAVAIQSRCCYFAAHVGG